MGITPTPFAAGNPVTETLLEARITTVEDFLNGGIVAGDLENTQWLEAQQFVAPDFRPEPMRRTRLQGTEVFADRHNNDYYEGFVITDDSIYNEWIAIPGLSRTIDVQPPRSETTADVVFRAGFYAIEVGGTSATPFSALASQFMVRQTADIGKPVTTRRIYAPSARIFHHVEYRFAGVTRGRKSFGVWVYRSPNSSAASRQWLFGWVKARNVICRAVYR